MMVRIAVISVNKEIYAHVYARMHIFNGICPYDKPKVHSEVKFGFPEKKLQSLKTFSIITAGEIWRGVLLKSGVLRPETLSILELQKNHGLHDAMVGRSL